MIKVLLFIAIIGIFVVGIHAQTTEFTYQGSLKDGANAANGNYDFEFLLFDSLTAGTQQGATLSRPSVAVANGSFSVKLDFGSQFPGANRFLEIHVRTAGGGAFTTLAPRQVISNTPYAVKSLSSDTATNAANAVNATNAATATNATQLGGVAAGQYVVTTDPRMTDERSPAAGSSNYIQNGTSQQAASNFNISGDGTLGGNLAANVVNAISGYNINGNLALRMDGIQSVYLGASGSSGNGNIMAGNGAGIQTSGSRNLFFGRFTGFDNQTGTDNSYFGNNSGFNAGQDNPGSSANTLIGGNTRTTTTAVSNSTALGYRAQVTQSNSLVLGSINGVNGSGADTNVGIGTTAPSQRLHVVGNGLFTGNLTVTGALNATLPAGSGNYIQNTASQQASSNLNISGNGTIGNNLVVNNGLDVGGHLQVGGSGSFQGMNVAGSFNLSGTGIVRAKVDSDSNAGLALTLNNQSKWSVATVTGGQFQIYNDAVGSNALWIDSATNNVGIGTTAPNVKLDVNGTIRTGLASGGSITLCRDIFNVISSCSSSIRYKENVNNFLSGLNLIRRLRPVSFTWKQGGKRDIGLVAEDVADVEPLLVTHNDKGQVEGVKYERVGVVLVNAVKEQQVQIEKLRQQIEQQRAEIEQLKKRAADFDALKALVCSGNVTAPICSHPLKHSKT